VTKDRNLAAVLNLIRLGKAFFIQTYINNNSVLMDLNQTTLPVVLSHDAKHWIGFGDLFGDGRIHRIRITNNSVESWASLGWGRFSEKYGLVLG
jgi:hypothetical protein